MTSFARWFFFGILLYAPWAYGSTRPWTIALLNELLWACAILSLIGWIQECRTPRLPWTPVTCLLLILAQTSWMWFNAHHDYDNSWWEFVDLAPAFPSLAGSWNKAASLQTLLELTGETIAFIIACDLLSERVWRQRLWTAIGLIGTSIVIFGLTQRALHAPSIFWLKEFTGTSFFGAYRYHANAGAYLNVIWPVLAVLTVKAWREEDKHVARAFWFGLFLLCVAACFMNDSRGANGITLLLLFPAAVAFLPFFRDRLAFVSGKVALTAFLLFGAFVAVLVVGGAMSQTQGRWELLHQEMNGDNVRFLVQQATCKMIPQAGWLGYGPGTFCTMFPCFSGYLGDKVSGLWVYAHEDYLQTVVEYGYLGALVWALFFFGGLAKALRGSFSHHLRSNDRIECRGATLALAGIALHSLFDFPLQVYSIQLYVMVFLAFAWTRTGRASSQEKTSPAEEPTSSSRKRRRTYH
jgi:O-antigen ligase